MPFGYSVYPWSEVGTVFLTLKYFVFPLTPYIYLLSNHISYASVSPLPLGEGKVSCHLFTPASFVGRAAGRPAVAACSQ